VRSIVRIRLGSLSTHLPGMELIAPLVAVSNFLQTMTGSPEDELEGKQLEGVANPVMTKMYQAAFGGGVPEGGTLHSCKGAWKSDSAEIIANDEGNRTTHSYIAFTDTERLLGDAAKKDRGVWKNDSVEIIANDKGNCTTPSYVMFTDTERLIGDASKNDMSAWKNDSVEIIANDKGNCTTPSYVMFTDTERLIGNAGKNDAGAWMNDIIPNDRDKSHVVFEATERLVGDATKNPKKSINLHEAATVLGAAVLDLLLLDATPLSVGLEIAGGVMTKLFERNTSVPNKKGQTVTTHVDNQPKTEAFECERAMTKDDNFYLDGIPPAPCGVPQIEVAFDSNTDGILHVSTRDRSTGKSNQITIIKEKGQLSQAVSDSMLQQADKLMTEDESNRPSNESHRAPGNQASTAHQGAREPGRYGPPGNQGIKQVTARNRVENYCKTKHNTLQKGQFHDKFEAGDKDKIEKAVQGTLDWREKSAC